MNIMKSVLKKSELLIWALVASLFFASCEYEPTGSNFREIPEPESEIPSVTMNLNADEIYIDGRANLIYDVRFTELELLLVEFYLDGNSVGSLETPTGSFEIAPLDGQYTFEMRIYSSTGSGSIANNIGAEAFIYKKEWTLFVDLSSIRPLEIVMLSKENDRLNCLWRCSPGIDFKAFEIFRKHQAGFQSLGFIQERETRTFSDTDILGGESAYFFVLHRHHLPPIYSDTAEFQSEAYIFDFRRMEILLAVFSWNRCTFPGNFDKYTLYETENDGTRKTIYESSSIEDTTYSIALDQLKHSVYSLEYCSAGDTANNLVYTRELYYLPGSEFIPDYSFITQPIRDYNNTYTSNFCYNTKTDQIVQLKFPGDDGILTGTANNQYILSGTNLYQNYNGVYELYEVIPTFPARYLNNDNLRVSLPYNPSFGYFEIEGESMLYKIWEDEVLSFLPWTEFQNGVLDPYGNYLFSFPEDRGELKIYKTVEDHMILQDPVYQTSISNCTAPPLFLPDWMMYVQKTGSVELWDYRNHEMIASYAGIQGKMIAYDPISATLLSFESPYLYVYAAADMSPVYGKFIGEYYCIESGKYCYLDRTVFLRGDTQGNAVMLKLHD